MCRAEYEEAFDLVWEVFLEYEAPDYTQDGVDEFFQSIHDEDYIFMLSVYGAFIENKLVGVIATRTNGSHIALFFVNGRYHKQGIGRRLFETVKSECKEKYMTVNSSPYAISIYRKLGFLDTDVQQVVNGLKFTPMRYAMPLGGAKN